MNREISVLMFARNYLSQIRWASFGLLGLFWSSFLGAQKACDSAAWAQFLVKVQTLSPESETLGPGFLKCGSQDSRDSAFFWLSFYFAKTQQTVRYAALSKELGPAPSTSGRAEVLYRAWQGDPLSLRVRIQSGEAGYADQVGMLLILARSSMRAKLYKEGLEAFHSYLRQSESQDAIEAERVFAYIWAEDQDGARAQIASLRRYELSPYLKQSLERAEALLQKPAKTQEVSTERGDWYQVAGRKLDDNRGYSSKSLLVFYKGLLELDLVASEERSQLEPEAHNFAAMNARKQLQLGARRTLDLGLGYLSAGKQHTMGHLQSKWSLGEHWELGLRGERTGLILSNRPLVETRNSTMRDSLSYSAAYGQRAKFEVAMRRDGGGPTYEDFKLTLKFGQNVENMWRQGVSLIAPFTYQHRPQPSPDLLSYPKEFRAGLGFEFVFTDGASFRWVNEALLESIDRSYYHNPQRFNKLLSTQLKSEVRAYLRSSLFYYARAEINNTERNPGEVADYRRSQILFGIALQDQVKEVGL